MLSCASAGSAHIVYAGDIGSPGVIAGLQWIAPVIAIRGNVDTGHWREHYPRTQAATLGGRCICGLQAFVEAGLKNKVEHRAGCHPFVLCLC
jgi:predicted phosphodiesterase